MSTKTPVYHDIDGFRLAKAFLHEEVRSASKYRPQTGDLFVVTYPKCGTTWLLQIVTLIYQKGKLPATNEEYFRLMPFLELVGGDYVDSLPRPIAIKTHFPFHLTPFSKNAKYIYMTRNPKDCCVSFYHHTTYFPGYRFTEGSFDDFFELFVSGETDFGDYFDHVISWYEHRNDPNVLFVSYEAMKANPKEYLMTIAGFIGEEYVLALRNDPSLVEKILKYTSFDFMKESVNKVYDQVLTASLDSARDDSMPLGMKSFMRVNAEATKNGFVSKSSFVRKGAVGEGKLVLTPEQEERLGKRMAERTQGSDVVKLWEKWL